VGTERGVGRDGAARDVHRRLRQGVALTGRPHQTQRGAGSLPLVPTA
jgi:hypothetical protein